MSDKLYAGFNFSLLDDPRFKEESVREELISPLIKRLGYANSGNTQVIRNHGLKHPFVSIGSSRRNITVIPDYLMKIAEKPAWVLEAKSPFEYINQTKHAEQAYSYAIHPEIRVNYFALCNGREFILYNISDEKPIMHFPLPAINQYIDLLHEVIGPTTIFTTNDVSIAKDLGLHIKRLGFRPTDKILIIGCQLMFIIKYTDDHFSFSAPIGTNESSTYLGTFDFNLETAMQLKMILGEQQFSKLIQPTQGKHLQFHLNDTLNLNITISLSEKDNLIENDKEIFLPLIVKDFIFS